MERGYVLCKQQGVPEVDVKPEPSSNESKKRHRILDFLNFDNICISSRVLYMHYTFTNKITKTLF